MLDHKTGNVVLRERGVLDGAELFLAFVLFFFSVAFLVTE